MIDTPRTDERTYPADAMGKTLVVHAEWAKHLERENIALRQNNNAKEISIFQLRKELNCERTLAVHVERENAALREKIIKLSKAYSLFEMLLKTDDECENAELRERLEILSKSNEKQTEEYICVDREYGLWKRATIDPARKDRP